MNAIVCVDQQMGIGKDNKLLISIPDDMKYFKEKTINKIVIMGRKTLESFPNQKPLKNRINIVITKDKNYKKENCIVLHSIDECLQYIKKYKTENVFIIGGSSIYQQFLPYCDTIYLTKVYQSYEADTFFPSVNQFDIVKKSELKKYQNILYQFMILKK